MADDNAAADAVDDRTDAPDDAPQLTEIEQLAAKAGWKPKDQWKGDEANWRPADAYLTEGRETAKTLKADMKRMERTLSGVERTTRAMTDRAIAAERERWEAEHERAVDEGDKAGAKQARDHLANLDKQRQPEEPSADTQAFVERNATWWGKDTEATEYAVQRADHYAKQGLSEKRQLAAVEKDMRQHFAELFPAETQARPPVKQQPSVGDPQRATRTAPREKGYATLPADARKQCDAWVENNKHRGSWATKEAWSQSFYEQEAVNG